MDGFLKAIGVIVFFAGAAAGVLTYPNGGLLTMVTILPLMISGAAIYGLGDIVENVRDIRRSAKKQADAMERMVDSNKPKIPQLYEPVFEDTALAMRRERKFD